MPEMPYNPPMLRSLTRLLLPVLVVSAAPAAQAAWFPPLKPSVARKKPTPRGVANTAAARPAAKPTARPTPSPRATARPMPTPTPEASLAPEDFPAADPTPEVVHPALRVDTWRATRSGATYHQVLEVDGSLWQGPWAIGARVLGVQDLAALGQLGVGGTPIALTLRRRFGAEGPAVPCFIAEGGWHSGLAPVGLGLVGLQGGVPVRWMTLEGGLRAGGFPTGDAWMVDASLGISGHLGPVGVGLGWRHLAFGRGGARVPFSDQLTGPYISGRLGF